jgi:hypothetical protein
VNRKTARAQQLLWSALLALAVGCGSGDDYPVPPATEGGVPPRIVLDGGDAGDGSDRGDGGTTDHPTTDAGDGGDDGSFKQVKVAVEIVSPTKDAIRVAATRFTPEIRVTVDSTDAMNPDTITVVTATVTKVGATTSGASAELKSTGIEQMPETAITIYRFTDTPVNIAKLESGMYELEVSATTSRGISTTEKVAFQIDAGPVIVVDSPGENEYYRDSATINVTINDPVFGGINGVTMLLGQHELTFSGPSNFQYSGTISFGAFNPPLEGDQLLTVRARNTNGTEAVVRRKFVSDNEGPVISDTVPATGALIGRVITISAKVADPAGVLESSVVAVIAHGDKMFEVKLEPPPAGSGPDVPYQALFDTARLPVNALFPSISFRASDIPGNQSSVGYLVSLDNTPPIADLDPPTDFYFVKNFNDIDTCSWPFDPLGNDAVDDGENVNQLFDVRARIEDQGNSPLFGGTDFTPIAGVDDDRVQLLILDDTSKALVVDTNDDGFCDAVNPLLTPTTTPMSSNDALLVNLTPIPPNGDSNYTASSPPVGAPCVSGSQAKPPGLLCATTSMTESLYYSAGTLAAVYGIPPVQAGSLQCVGRQFDALGNHVADGWICLAVAVADSLGNLQVSSPLRVCVDKDGQGDECGANRPTIPDCTGKQTASKPDVVIDATTPCLPWRNYPATEFRRAR